MIGLILVAAGSGQRLGADIPKALIRVAGESLIGHCLATAATVVGIDHVVVVAPEREVAALQQQAPAVTVVAGGQTRDASVRAGLEALPGCSHVLVHDAARPFTPAEVFERVIAALQEGAVSVVPALPVADTIKRVRDGLVVQTLDRAELVAVQTPQGFRTDALRAAHEARTGEVTDDAMLMEQTGVQVRVVTGSDHAFKITTPFDLAVARAMREQ